MMKLFPRTFLNLIVSGNGTENLICFVSLFLVMFYTENNVILPYFNM